MAKTEAQKKAQKNWDEKNRAHASYLKSRSAAKSFIKNKATLEDLEMLKETMRIREEELNNA